MSIQKQVKIIKKGEDEGNLLHWTLLTEKERMLELEMMRTQVNKSKYGSRQEFQRVYRVIKRA